MLHIPDETLARLREERELAPLPVSKVAAILKGASLRPTRQRLELGRLLFRDAHRHVTAEDLFQDALDTGVPLSLATVYNTLNNFAEAGLIRRVTLNGGRTYFDTDAGDHHHFYVEAEDRIIDIPPGQVQIGKLPVAPDGYEITKVDVVIRLARIQTKSGQGCRGQAGSGCIRCGACTRVEGDSSRVHDEVDHTNAQEWKLEP